MPARTDNFNGRSGAPLAGATPSDGGSAWVEYGTTAFFTSAGGQALVSVGGQKPAALESSISDVDVQVTIDTWTSTSIGGLAFRIVDGNNYLFAQFRGSAVGSPDTLFLASEISGAVNVISSASVSLASSNIIRVRGVGTAITIYVNGSPVHSDTTSLYQTATQHGMWPQEISTVFDDFSIIAAGGGGATFMPAPPFIVRQAVKQAAYF